jgi:hypothetical protein
MKAGREHRVPLSDAAVGILEAQAPGAARAKEAFVFSASAAPIDRRWFESRMSPA